VLAPDHPDPLFWPLLIFAAVTVVFAITVVKLVSLLVRRDPGHHPQRAEGGGANIHDASTHHTTSIGEIKVKLERPEKDG